ncbi:hypothetical protein PC116_g24421 [Phytophthora cactorum]|nr:hypothetical protein PC116_g24421 [Phytophthora cactorum]
MSFISGFNTGPKCYTPDFEDSMNFTLSMSPPRLVPARSWRA